MKFGRSINLVSIVVAVFVVFGCGTPPTEDDSTPTVKQETLDMSEPLNESVYVEIVPIEGGKCAINPVERIMKNEQGNPVNQVTFTNFTNYEVKIQFDEVGAIGDTTAQSLPRETPVTFQIHTWTSQTEYKYSVVDGCEWQGPPAGPRVVIP
jgi:hypothetical protein